MSYADLQALEWYVDAGVDIAIATEPNNRFDQKVDLSAFTPEPEQAKQLTPARSKQSTSGVITKAKDIASGCQTLEALKDAITQFTDHPLKSTATHMVFGDGVTDNPKIMVIGDPPSNDEDRTGQAFSGVDGQLLDKILASIGCSRQTDCYVTHITHWRPPGNSTPTDEALACSKPFIEKQIDLINPQYLMIIGQHAARSLLDTDKTMSRIRGEWFDYGTKSIPTLVTFAPSFLMNNPAQKRKVWHDMLSLKERMNA